MKPADKAKAQSVVNEILSGEFDERTVEELFIRLRDVSNGAFRDFGHYMAHPKERDRGMAVDQISSIYCSLKAFDKYHTEKHKFDISDLPIYLIDYFHFQLDILSSINKKDMKLKFGAKDKLHKLIDQVFKIEGGKVVSKRKISVDEWDFFSHLTSVVGSEAIYTKQNVIKFVISTIKQNGLNINEERFKAQGDAFILCLMCSLHETLHDVADRTKGLCKLGFIHDGTYEQAISDASMRSFRLALTMNLIVDCIKGDMMVRITLLDTDMPAVEHCLAGDINMLIGRKNEIDTYLTPDHSSYLKVGKNFKLERIIL